VKPPPVAGGRDSSPSRRFFPGSSDCGLHQQPACARRICGRRRRCTCGSRRVRQEIYWSYTGAMAFGWAGPHWCQKFLDGVHLSAESIHIRNRRRGSYRWNELFFI
jgi:hypothetical protein